MHLDALYMRILASIPRKTWLLTQQVLVVINRLPFPVLRCTKGLSVILGIELSKIYTAINDLYSILDISLDDVYSPLHFHHASFLDFLREDTRSKEFCTPFQAILRYIEERGLRIWLDFKKQSPRGPKYKDRWHKYALQFHSNINVPADASKLFNEYLFQWVHQALRQSLLRKWNLALKETSAQYWDQIVEILCQVDVDTLLQGLLTCKDVATFWSDVWKIRRKDLSDAGIVYEIRLEQLQFDHILPEDYPNHSVRRLFRDPIQEAGTVSLPLNRNKFDEYESGLKYFQQHNPRLPVLICGTRGNRLAVIMYEYSEDDFKERPLHAEPWSELNFDRDLYLYRGYYCLPYRDDV